MSWLRRQYDRGKALWRRALEENASPKKFAQAVALGAFINACPLYGARQVIAAFLAWRLRLNKLTAVLSCHLLLGPLGALSIVAEVQLGCRILGRQLLELPMLHRQPELAFDELFRLARASLLPWTVGAAVIAPPFALLCGLAAYPLAKRYHARKALRLAAENASATPEKLADPAK